MVLVDGLKARSTSTQPATSGDSRPLILQRLAVSVYTSTLTGSDPIQPLTLACNVRQPASQTTWYSSRQIRPSSANTDVPPSCQNGA
jgi:hypothetical protein